MLSFLLPHIPSFCLVTCPLDPPSLPFFNQSISIPWLVHSVILYYSLLPFKHCFFTSSSFFFSILEAFQGFASVFVPFYLSPPWFKPHTSQITHRDTRRSHFMASESLVKHENSAPCGAKCVSRCWPSTNPKKYSLPEDLFFFIWKSNNITKQLQSPDCDASLFSARAYLDWRATVLKPNIS